MKELTRMIREDMKPALGVTEPGAIAFAVAEAVSHTRGVIRKITVSMNSGMYKNAFTCGIPGTDQVGSAYAAALGAVAGRPEKGLEALADVTKEDNRKADALIRAGKVKIVLDSISSRIFIEASVETEEDTAVVTIRDSHTNIVCEEVNGRSLPGQRMNRRSGKKTAERLGIRSTAIPCRIWSPILRPWTGRSLPS